MPQIFNSVLAKETFGELDKELVQMKAGQDMFKVR